MFPAAAARCTLLFFPASLLYLLLPALAGAEEFTGKVVGVADGDTITVLHNKKPVRVRLYGVDCPEKNHPFGDKARQFMSGMVFGMSVKILITNKDRNGRVVAKVYVTRAWRWNDLKGEHSSPPTDITHYLNEELLLNGLAWWDKKHSPKDNQLKKLEAEAREAKRGIWKDGNPVPPWDWRRGKRTAGPPGPDPKLNCFQACMRRNAMRAVVAEVIEVDCRSKCSRGGAALPTPRHPDSAAAGPPDAINFHGNVRSRAAMLFRSQVASRWPDSAVSEGNNQPSLPLTRAASSPASGSGTTSRGLPASVLASGIQSTTRPGVTSTSLATRAMISPARRPSSSAISTATAGSRVRRLLTGYTPDGSPQEMSAT